MIISDLVVWWYSGGLRFFSSKLFEKLKNTLDFFSIFDLLRTLFSPFRQISAEGTSSLALDARLRAFLDRLFSRFFGAFVRIFIILVGTILLFIQFIFSLGLILIWPFLPLFPLLSIFLYFNGVVF